MSSFNQWPWIYLLHNFLNSAESIDTLASRIIEYENFRPVMFIWYVLLVKETDENCIMKYILLGGRIADIARTPHPEKHVLVRKLLTWAFYAVGRRSVSKIMYARLRRLLSIWQDNNVHGYEWSRAMMNVYNGIHPKTLGVQDLKLDFGEIAEPCAIENGMEASKIIDNVSEYQVNVWKEVKNKNIVMYRDYAEQGTPHISNDGMIEQGEITDGTHNLEHYKSRKPCFPFELTTDLICSLLNKENLSVSTESDTSSDEDTSCSSSSSSSSSISSITSNTNSNTIKSDLDHEKSDNQLIESNDIWTYMIRANLSNFSSSCCSSSSSSSSSSSRCSECNCTCSRGSRSSSSSSSNSSSNSGSSSRSCSSKHQKFRSRNSTEAEKNKQGKTLKNFPENGIDINRWVDPISLLTPVPTTTTILVKKLDILPPPLESLVYTIPTSAPASTEIDVDVPLLTEITVFETEPVSAISVTKSSTILMQDEIELLEFLTAEIPQIQSSISRPKSTRKTPPKIQRTTTCKSRGKDMNTIMAAYAKSPIDVQFSDDADDEEIHAKKPRLDSPPKRSGKNMEVLMRYLHDGAAMKAY